MMMLQGKRSLVMMRSSVQGGRSIAITTAAGRSIVRQRLGGGCHHHVIARGRMGGGSRMIPGGGGKVMMTRRCLSTSGSGGAHGGGGGPSLDVVSAIKSGLIGMLAGTFGSLVGMGGAFVMIPAMTGILKFSQHQAHGTSLACVITTGAGGAISYASAGAVDWEAAAFVAGCGMLTARLGAVLSGKLSEAALKKACGIFQICIAPTVPFKEQILALGRKSSSTIVGKEGDGNDKAVVVPATEGDQMGRRAVLGTIGLGSGFLAGVFGVGGGAITVPALTIGLNMSHYQALGTSLAAMVPTALVGTYAHHKQGHVLWSMLGPLALGSVTGSYVGGKEIALRIPEEYLKWGFCVMMIVLGSKSVMSGYQAAAAAKAASAASKVIVQK